MNELQVIRLEDYTPPPYLVDEIELNVELVPTATLVQAQLRLRANPEAGVPAGRLRLDGRQLELLAIAVDGAPLDSSAYLLDDEGLISYNFV